MHVSRVCEFRGVSVGVPVSLASACGGPAEIDGEVTTPAVQGIVENQAGAHVSGAVVAVAWKPGACQDELLTFPSDTTGGGGVYEVKAWGWGTFSEACVRVTAEPPAGSALLGATVQIGAVPLHPKNGLDTLSVDLRLNPS